MNKRTLTAGFVTTVIFAFSILGAGCKKEEAKEATPVSTPEPAKAAAPANAPEQAGGDIFKAQLTTDAPPRNMKAGATAVVPVRVKNASSSTWTKDKAKPINLSYHWRNAKDHKAVVWDGTRMMIAKDIAPGEEVVINAKITAPKAAGNYLLELDMVRDDQEGGWFGKKGSEIKSMPVTVK